MRDAPRKQLSIACRCFLCAEAAIVLVLARVGVKLFHVEPLSRVGCLLLRCFNIGLFNMFSEGTLASALRVRRVSRFIPGSFCLQQALAVQWLIARRGRSSTLHVGVSIRKQGLSSHAWVTVGGSVLIGGPEAPRLYREILRIQ